ncbi:serine/threonine-protein kinase VRK1 isoform X2 [Cololabis saira]|uniref:serine/threonine-protein kinase VRK1 isoform X2 n=1 Tax=Cololabis saira TaxID=129043 RepID=UPI002AD4F9D2|nr:serine/threonine-protein kinase VRK1 isoform X2 [Cololabis saira]
MPPKAKAAVRARAPAKRKLAEEFPPGEVLTDVGKKSWKLGPPVGRGGFGLLYLADRNSDRPVGSDAPFVVKVEPSDNGPLFCEQHFYMRAGEPELIKTWMKTHKLKHLGVPRFWGFGLHETGGNKYRFIVIDRLGTDLQKKFEESGRKFPRKLVLQLGLRLLDVLEFIHQNEYVHADIKASNLLLSYRDPDQVYLLDYGLAYRYAPDGVHKPYREDPKRCHDGTIEFTSIDAHTGVACSRRSDLEILSYCLLQWLCGRLPWEDRLQDPVYVRDAKTRSRENIPEFLKQCFPSQDPPGEIRSFLELVWSLEYQDKPPYEKLRSVLQTGLKNIRATDDGKLDFPPAVAAATEPPPAKKTTKRKKAAAKGAEEDGSPVKKQKVSKATELNGVKTSPKKSSKVALKSPKVALKDQKVPRKLVEPKSVRPVATATPGISQRTRAKRVVS